MDIILRDACIYTPIEKNYGSLKIEDGKIVFFGDDKEISHEGHIIDLAGEIISPGFIDLHTHGACGIDFLDNAQSWQAMEKYFISHGTTSYLATLMSASHDRLLGAIEGIAQKIKNENTHCIGIHLEGPFINPECRGIHPLEHLIKPSLEKIEEYIKAGQGLIKMITLAPELDTHHEIISNLARRGIIVAGGHSGANFETAKEAIGAGMHYSVHTGNAMGSFHHRQPGILGAFLDDNRVSCEIIADGIHLHPATLKLFYKLKEAKNIILSTDSAPLAGLPEGRYPWQNEQFIINENRIVNKEGKLAGSSLNMAQAVKNMVKWSGCSLPEALQMATLNPARILGLKKGQIKVGYDADIVALNSDLAVKFVIQKGKIVWP